MHLSSALLLTGAALAAAQSTTVASSSPTSTSTAAATHTVVVGEKGNDYTPASTNAKVGDSIVFQFASSSTHDVLQAEYARPCEARDQGSFYSGDLNNKGENDQFIIKVNDTNPIWYFCSVARHCQDGMVGVINPPQKTEGGYTIEGWTAASKKTTASNNTFVEAAQGGLFAKGEKKGGSGTEEGNATQTDEEEPAATTSEGGAAGLVAQGGFVAGVGAFVAALML